MFIIKRKHFKFISITILLFFLTNCGLKDVNRTHGINFLENREKSLIINETNKNDVIRIIGSPHSQSITDNNTWIYFERVITKGKLHKLGKNILEKNNVLELKFNNYGILKSKKIIKKDEMNKVAYSKKKTVNVVEQKSFVGKFLSSMKQKMYRKDKK
tara:strand:+ start:822 stop:1295 length:474 start_codon:yes stop_codon:yes gene_type:complete